MKKYKENYDFYLFSQLCSNAEIDSEPYDVQFEIKEELFNEFMPSIYNDANKNLYECIVKFVEDKFIEHKLPPSKTYGEYLLKAMNKFDISNQEARKRYGQFTISQWKQIL